MAPNNIFSSVDPRRNIMIAAQVTDTSRFKDRIEVAALYLYIDLGLAIHFSGDDHDVVWRAGLLKLPEVFGTTDPSEKEILSPPRVAYDAFAGDVWQLGTTFRLLFGNVRPARHSFRACLSDNGGRLSLR